MRRFLSTVFYTIAAASLLAALKVPALLLMTGFFAFIGYVVRSGSGVETEESALTENVDFNGHPDSDDDSILSQKALGYGFYGWVFRDQRDY